MKKLAIAADHAGYELKEKLKAHLSALGWELQDFGTHSSESMDYPDVAHPLSSAVEQGEFEFGVLICGSANGVAMSANKHSGIRAAICWNNEIASLARQHNNANVICIPARFVSTEEAESMLDVFLDTPFEGGRHQRRVDKVACR
ncbi:MAG: ribose 5-phosphate isomerase B [Bacteroidia bacterium]